jgi:hypothetical protein
MPKRTNDFQSLVTLIERQLAPSGTRVTESKLIRDPRENEEREIDIFIEAQAGVHRISIGVECVDRKRKASVEWIDKIIGKYRNLPVAKIIAVSRAGFTKSALKKAVGANIVPLTLAEAVAADWVTVVDKLTTINLESFLLPYPTGIKLVFAGDTPPSLPPGFDVRQAILYTPTGAVRGKLHEVADRVLSDPAFLETVEKQAFTDSGTNIELELRFEPGSYLLDSTDTKHEIYSLRIDAKCRKEKSIVALERASYDSAQVAVGTGDTFGRRIAFAAVEHPDKQATLGFSIRQAKNDPTGERRRSKP